MGWFAGQLLILLLVAFLVGLLAGYLWWVWGWKKYRDEQVTTDVDRQQHRSGSSAVGVGAGAAAGAAAAGASGGTGTTASGGTGTAAAGGSQIRSLVGSGGARRADADTDAAGDGDADATADEAGVIDLTDGATLAAVSADLDEVRTLLADRTEELTAARASLATAERSLLDSQAELRTNQEALSSVSAELRTATDDLAACGQARGELQQRLDALQLELDAAREQARKADAERESVIDLRDENEALREQVRIATLAGGTGGTGDTGGAASEGSGSAGGGSSSTSGGPVVARIVGDYGDDDLERIEGIGPKIGDALRAAGIRSFPHLLASDDGTLRAALEAAGLRFAPSLPTWREQAAFLVRGDETGFVAFTEQLVAGRKPGSTKGSR